MFSLSYRPEHDLPWRISWNHTPMLYLEQPRDAAAMITNLAMGAHINRIRTELDAWEVVEGLHEPFLELCTGKIHIPA